MLRSRDNQPFVFWPFLIRIRLNLGLNNLKFVQKSISAGNLVGVQSVFRRRSVGVLHA